MAAVAAGRLARGHALQRSASLSLSLSLSPCDKARKRGGARTLARRSVPSGSKPAPIRRLVKLLEGGGGICGGGGGG